MDSTAVASIERPDLLFFVDYGQLAAAGEVRAARAISAALGIRLGVHRTDLSALGAGTMVAGKVVNPAAPEFWPFRNQLLVTLAAMAYADHQPLEILLGSVAGDLTHPDGTQAFVAAMDAVLASQGQFRLRAPAIGLSARTLLNRARLDQEILGWTFSCHTGAWACGQCRGCYKHDELKHIPS